MIFTPISFIIILSLLVGLQRCKNKSGFSYFILTLLIIFDLFVNRGFFIKFGESVLYYNEFMIVICFITIIYCLDDLILSKYNIMIALSLLISILVGFLLIIFDPPQFTIVPFGILMDSIYWNSADKAPVSFYTGNCLKFFRIVIYIPILFYLGSKNVSKGKLMGLIIEITKWYMVIVYIELFFKLTELQFMYEKLLNFMFQDEANVIFTRFGFITLSGLTREPGHLAVAMFFPGMILASMRKHKLLFFSIILILILSMSFAGIIIAFMLLLVYLYFELIKNANIFYIFKILLIVFGIVLFIINSNNKLLVYNIDRVFSLFQGGDIGSEGIRWWTITESFGYFIERPFWGIGLGTANSYGFISSIISNIGFVGTFLWIYLHKRVLKCKIILLNFFIVIIVGIFCGDIGWMYSIKGTLLFVIASKPALPHSFENSME